MDARKEWLVIYFDEDLHVEEFDSSDNAVDFIRGRIEAGHRDAMLYRHVPFTVYVDIEVLGERPKRRRNSSPGAAGSAGGEGATPEPEGPKGVAEAKEPNGSPKPAAPGSIPGRPAIDTPSCGGSLCTIEVGGKVIHRLDQSCSKFSGTSKRARA